MLIWFSKWPWPGEIREAVFLTTTLDSFIPYIDMSNPDWESKPAYLMELPARNKDLVEFFRNWEKDLYNESEQTTEQGV